MVTKVSNIGTGLGKAQSLHVATYFAEILSKLQKFSLVYRWWFRHEAP